MSGALAVSALVVGTILVAAPVSAATIDSYDSIPVVLPGNVGSVSFQAQATSEFGQRVQVSTPGAPLGSVEVGFSTWACETGSWTAGCLTPPGASYVHPITVTVYSVVAGAPGAVLATTTEPVTVPFRPSANPAPLPAGCDVGSTRWRSVADNSCYNGMLFTWEFDLSAAGAALPTEVIVGVAFNTNTYGAAPIGVTGPYDSLNVAYGGTVIAGTLPDPDQVFRNSIAGGRAPGFTADTGWSDEGPVMLRLSFTEPEPAPSLPGTGLTGAQDAALGGAVLVLLGGLALVTVRRSRATRG